MSERKHSVKRKAAPKRRRPKSGARGRPAGVPMTRASIQKGVHTRMMNHCVKKCLEGPSAAKVAGGRRGAANNPWVAFVKRWRGPPDARGKYRMTYQEAMKQASASGEYNKAPRRQRAGRQNLDHFDFGPGW